MPFSRPSWDDVTTKHLPPPPPQVARGAEFCLRSTDTLAIHLVVRVMGEGGKEKLFL